MQSTTVHSMYRRCVDIEMVLRVTKRLSLVAVSRTGAVHLHTVHNLNKSICIVPVHSFTIRKQSENNPLHFKKSLFDFLKINLHNRI